MKEIQKGLLIADTHYPFYDKPTFSIAKQISNDIKPDKLIFLGDNWDAYGTSKYTQQNAEDGLIETYNEMLKFKEEIFIPLQESTKNKKLETILLLGNHDGQRLVHYFRRLQEVGNLNLYNYWKNKFNFKKIFECKVIEYNDSLKIGKCNIIHGEKHNKFHTASHLDLYMGSVQTGHLHTTQIYTRISKGNIPYQGISIPAMGDINPEYMNKMANKWINGLCVDYFMPDGTFFYDIVQVIKKKTIFQGKLYTG